MAAASACSIPCGHPCQQIIAGQDVRIAESPVYTLGLSEKAGSRGVSHRNENNGELLARCRKGNRARKPCWPANSPTQQFCSLASGMQLYIFSNYKACTKEPPASTAPHCNTAALHCTHPHARDAIRIVAAGVGARVGSRWGVLISIFWLPTINSSSLCSLCGEASSFPPRKPFCIHTQPKA